MINAGRQLAKPSLFATDLHVHSSATLIQCFFKLFLNRLLHETNRWTISFSSLSILFTVMCNSLDKNDGKDRVFIKPRKS